MVNVTATLAGLLETPVAVEVTGTVAVYEPAARVPSVAVTVSVAGAVVVLRDALSQPVAPVPYVMTPVANPDSVPTPPFVTETVCAAGFAPPVAPLKESVVEESAISGAGAVAVAVNVIGLPLSPEAVAVSVFDPVAAPSVQLPTVARPELFVV